jgi:hypothetical protein
MNVDQQLLMVLEAAWLRLWHGDENEILCEANRLQATYYSSWDQCMCMQPAVAPLGARVFGKRH